MMEHTHPLAKVQSLIDHLKSATKVKNDHTEAEVEALWSGLEDMLTMIATSKTRQEGSNVGVDKTTGGIDQDRGSGNGDRNKD